MKLSDMVYQYVMCVLRSSKQAQHSNSNSFSLFGTEVFHMKIYVELAGQVLYSTNSSMGSCISAKYLVGYKIYIILLYWLHGNVLQNCF